MCANRNCFARNRLIRVTVVAMLAFTAAASAGDEDVLPAFPGAEGFGAASVAPSAG